MQRCRETQSVLKVTYNYESYLLKVIIILCVRMFLHMCTYFLCLSCEHILQPFSAIPQLSETTECPTEVLTVEYCVSIPEPGIMRPVCFTKLRAIFSTHRIAKTSNRCYLLQMHWQTEKMHSVNTWYWKYGVPVPFSGGEIKFWQQPEYPALCSCPSADLKWAHSQYSWYCIAGKKEAYMAQITRMTHRRSK